MTLRVLGTTLFLVLTICSLGCHHHRACCRRSCCPTQCCGYLDVAPPPATLGVPH